MDPGEAEAFGGQVGTGRDRETRNGEGRKEACVCGGVSNIKKSIFIDFHLLHIYKMWRVMEFCLASLLSNTTEGTDSRLAWALSRGVSRFSAG